MENASKALLMAAGVLVGVLVLSLAVYMFLTFSERASEINSDVEQQQLIQWNSRYTSYEGKNNLTIYDVVTVANMAKENNQFYADAIDEYVVEVVLAGSDTKILASKSGSYSKAKLNELIVFDANSITATNSVLPNYTCKIDYTKNHANGRIGKVIFEKK